MRDDDKCGLENIVGKVLILFGDDVFLLVVGGVDLEFIELEGGGENVEGGFLVVPEVLVRGLEDELLLRVLVQQASHLLHLLL